MDKTKQLLEEAVEEIVERPSLESKLKSGKSLTVKLGADPTSPDLHLGHALVLRKLRQFQELGHRAVFIIGDYTARIGDPSGRSKIRTPMSSVEIKKNAETYFKQVGKIIILKKAEIRYNSEWFSQMTLEDFIKIAGHFSAQRIMDREDFKKRIGAGEEVFQHETFYQIMQAYDSVAVGADVELGGRDQRLNLLAGRELQKKMGLPEQDLVIMPILIGLNGKEKMSKSLGNYVGLAESPDSMFGKIMSIPDESIEQYFQYAACCSLEEIEDLRGRLKKENPRDVKLELSERIVALYHGNFKAREARQKFIKMFSQKDYGDVGDAVTLSYGKRQVADVLLEAGAAKSKSEARRLIAGKAVSIDGKIINDAKTKIDVRKGMVLKAGKKKIYKVC